MNNGESAPREDFYETNSRTLSCFARFFLIMLTATVIVATYILFLFEPLRYLIDSVSIVSKGVAGAGATWLLAIGMVFLFSVASYISMRALLITFFLSGCLALFVAGCLGPAMQGMI